jgi:tRNA modification GTPase
MWLRDLAGYPIIYILLMLLSSSCLSRRGRALKMASRAGSKWRYVPLSQRMAITSTSEFYDKRVTAGLAGDTIFALSSGPMTKTGVAVIRLSGPEARRALEVLQTVPEAKRAPSPTKLPEFPAPRRACVRNLWDPKTGDMLDQALVLWMPGPHSFTGEDVVELHTHGSRAVIQGVFTALEYMDSDPAQYLSTTDGGIRAAERGEFTRRAFDNGRMDLTEVEGLSDLLDAETSLQRKQALKQMEGHLGATFERWRAVIVRCLAHTEAVIDFGDDDREDDVDDSSIYVLIPQVQALRNEIELHLKDGRKGELVRGGLRIALAGPPNAGKSSLMNALARRPAAIVSPIAGTTRDIVEVRMDLGGVSCLVSDTAGLRKNTDDPIEEEGIRRAKDAFRRAHLKLFVGDASDSQSVHQASKMLQALIPEDEDRTEQLLNDHGDRDGGGEEEEEEAGGLGANSRVLMVLNKCDLVPGKGTMQEMSSTVAAGGVEVVPLSCTTGEGLATLEEVIERNVKDLVSAGGEEGALITRERHRRHLQRCAVHLESFLTGRLPMDAAAEELRLASLELGRVTGRVDVEELLDVIFRDFCIGK